MQPYFFPYIGYWQLINAVDVFVVYDDVNYITRGWINRNRILVEGQAKYINLSLSKASQNKVIREIEVNYDERLVRKTLCTLRHAYRKAPQYDSAQPVIEKILRSNKKKVSEFLLESIYRICEFLEIDKHIVLSSEIEKNNLLRGQEKVLEICRCLGADTYINPIGGVGLYSFQRFKEEAINLYFLRSIPIFYKQFENEFQENLSIIDVMMFNSAEKIKSFLRNYELLSKCDFAGEKYESK